MAILVMKERLERKNSSVYDRYLLYLSLFTFFLRCPSFFRIFLVVV